jgi:hypothetical protein
MKAIRDAEEATIEAAVTSAVTQARAEYELLMTDWEAKTEQWRKQTVGACEELLSIARSQLHDANVENQRLQLDVLSKSAEIAELRVTIDELRAAPLFVPPEPAIPVAPAPLTGTPGVAEELSTADIDSFLAQPSSSMSGGSSPASSRDRVGHPLPSGDSDLDQRTVHGSADVSKGSSATESVCVEESTSISFGTLALSHGTTSDSIDALTCIVWHAVEA